jgi:hypothetical protein
MREEVPQLTSARSARSATSARNCQPWAAAGHTIVHIDSQMEMGGAVHGSIPQGGPSAGNGSSGGANTSWPSHGLGPQDAADYSVLYCYILW